MRFRIPLLWATGLFLAFQLPLEAQQDGAYLFRTYCAICHEGPGAESRAPQADVMKQMTPEHILQVLETGAMKAQAAERSRAQRRTLAEYLAGKPFGSTPPDLIPRAAFCRDGAGAFQSALDGPVWNGWGVNITNTRFQPAASARLTAANVPRLKLKWAFGYPGATSGGTQPVVAGGRLYVGTAEGDLYSLDANTGCVHWIFEADAGIRSAVSIGKTAGGRLAAYFGDQSANVYSVDAETGKILWRRKIDEHPRAAVTAAPALYAGRLYVGVSSREESQVGDPKYPCCEFRGSMVALEASDGKVLWKTYTIADEAHQLGKNSAGTTMWGPSGVPIWNSPTIDLKRNVLYAGTGNNYSTPATDASDAVIAFDMATGKIRWISQVSENDVWNGSCRQPDRSTLVCPDSDAPDADFASSPILAEAAGRQLILAGNKAGMLYALDPDRKGKVVWKQSNGKAGTSGGIMWGSAADAEKVYAPNAYFNAAEPQSTGGISAFEISTGRKIWFAPPPSCNGRKSCKPSHAAAVTAIPGVLFSGTWDGRLRAYSTTDGTNIWEYDTAREFETVNGVKANGGSMSNGGATVVGGMVFVNSGYSHHGGMVPGNVLLALGIE